MKNFLMKAVTASGFVAALALVCVAQQTPVQTTTTAPSAPVREGMRQGHHGEHGMEAMLGSLNLSDAQRQQIGAITSRYKSNMQAQHREAHALKKQEKQGATLTADQQARLQTLHEQLKASEKQEYQEIVALLTPDQRAQLKAKKQEMRMQKKTNGAFNENRPPNQ